jgi:Na+-translocating ferredoxin:NAD+ oxidoreductase RnfE subunit
LNRIYAKSFRRFLRITRGTFYANSVLTTGLALPLAVVPTTTLQNGVAVSALVGAVTVPVALVGTLLRRTRWRVPVCMVVAALCLLVFTRLLSATRPFWKVSAHIFRSLPPIRCFSRSRTARAGPSAARFSIPYVFCLGFTIAACAVGAVREILSLRTIWSEPLKSFRFA